jgi:hypothetical protein
MRLVVAVAIVITAQLGLNELNAPHYVFYGVSIALGLAALAWPKSRQS